eukprot:Sdes_comp23258_c0_seq1m21539
MSLNFQFHNGIKIPAIGLGTWRMNDESVAKMVPAALDLGYRLIDTAEIYRNEKAIGKALEKYFKSPKSTISRKDIFLTTKISTASQGRKNAIQSIQNSLLNLGVDYLDLVLIHWPGCSGISPEDPEASLLRRETWKVLEEFYEKGVIKSIGVSNYRVNHLKELLSEAKIQPMLNQFECHILSSQTELRKFCEFAGAVEISFLPQLKLPPKTVEKKKIIFQSYSTLGSGELLHPSNPICLKISAMKYFPATCSTLDEKSKKSVAQILLRWALQSGMAIIPKTSNEKHLESNLCVCDFSIHEQDMKILDGFNSGEIFCWDPKTVYSQCLD